MNTDDTLEAAEAAIKAECRLATVIEPRQRRLGRALADLGLPAGWATANEDGTVDFATLTERQADQVLRLLEDIAANRPIQVIVTRGGPSLFDPGAPAGPLPAPVMSSVHVVVPQ